MTPESDFPYIVVVGTSAGGVEALSELVKSLPVDFPAPVLITHHQSPQSRSMMPAILSRAGALTARHALNNLPLEAGKIFVAPPDYHMLVKPGYIALGRGPRENCTRPAIDPLFRTAAGVYGPRVIAIVLTGNLDDGTAGLAIVKQHGGIAIVQDPTEAPYPSMPVSAIDNVAVDHVLSVREMGALLQRLVATPIVEPNPQHEVIMERDPDPAEDVTYAVRGDAGRLKPSVFTCPDCHGTLFEVDDARGLPRYRCRVGHAYSSGSLASQQGDRVEEALWTALRSIEERAALIQRMAERAKQQGKQAGYRRYSQELLDMEARATLLRQILSQGQIDAEDAEEQVE